jgi:hypothetical protein
MREIKPLSELEREEAQRIAETKLENSDYGHLLKRYELTVRILERKLTIARRGPIG